MYKTLSETNERFSYSLELPHYNKLRITTVGASRVLVVLRLPKNPEEWLQISEESLIAQRCAYWVSLYNAPEVADQKSRTIYIPTANILSPDGLIQLMTRFSRQEVIPYEHE